MSRVKLLSAATCLVAAISILTPACSPTPKGGDSGNNDHASYNVGGTLTGLVGTVVLENNGGDDLSLTSNGAFTFANGLADGAAYDVTVAGQPSGQSCSVAHGSGAIAGANVSDIVVTCIDNSTPTYTVGGSVSGLSGTLLLHNNGGDDLSLTANGAFTFATALADNAAYSVTVASQPNGQSCIVTNGTGKIAGANVSNVAVTCIDNNVPTHTLGGTLSGLSGTVVLQNNGGDDLTLTADGAFAFATAVPEGAPYTVTVASPPTNQACAIDAGSGTMATGEVTAIVITCADFHSPYLLASGANQNSMVVRNDGSLWLGGDSAQGMLGNGTTSHNPPWRGNSDMALPVADLAQPIVAVASKGGHVLALDNAGVVWAWGDNSLGQTGQSDTTTEVSVPTAVPGVNNAVAIAAGVNHSLALQADGTLLSWGLNTDGCLGQGSLTNGASFGAAAVDLSALAAAGRSLVAIDAGDTHSVALADDGSVWAWGNGGAGQTGHNGTTDVATPLPVRREADDTLLDGIIAVEAGRDHNVALRADGTLWLWGAGAAGQLGLGDTAGHRGAVELSVVAGHRVTRIGAGAYTSFAIDDTGAAWGWGEDGNGEAGIATAGSDVMVPTQLTAFAGVTLTTLGGGATHGIARDDTGALWTWGKNTYGALLDGTQTDNAVPNPIYPSYDRSVAALASAGSDTANGNGFALLDNGEVWAWGYGPDALSTDHAGSSPGLVTALVGKTITEVVPTPSGAYAVVDDGTVWAWGTTNSRGQLGDGTTTASITPVQVCKTYDTQASTCTQYLAGIVHVAAGSGFAIALDSNGYVWSWGDNRYGQLGQGSGVTCGSGQWAGVGPVVDSNGTALSGIAEVSAGASHAAAVATVGRVWAWGLATAGRLGNFSTSLPTCYNNFSATSALPVCAADIAGVDNNAKLAVCNNSSSPQYLGGVAHVDLGGAMAVALSTSGAIYTWGSNSRGELGDGNIGGSAWQMIPLTVDITALGARQIKGVSAGLDFVLVRADDGTVWGWGNNSKAQLGTSPTGTACSDGTDCRLAPVMADGLTSVSIVDVYAGGESALALATDGSVWSWGSNVYGELATQARTVYGFSGALSDAAQPVLLLP